MGVDIFTDFDYAAVERGLAQFSSLSAEAARSAPLKASRAFVRRVVDITPPASAGRTGLAARRAGERRIDGDLGKIFAPAIITGKRPEQWPDVEALYDAVMAGRKGRKVGKTQQIFHVDARKLEALRQKLYGRVGYLAAGWNASAQQLGVELPAWVRRHGTEHGACQVTTADNGVMVVLTNRVQYSNDVDGYPRRVQFALDYEGAALVRETEYLLSLAGVHAGFVLD